jgi:hypothetical protein
MNIGNIVYENNLVNHKKIDYINYINDSIRYEDINKNLPTLYVGWSFMKSVNPNNEAIQNANILHKKIIDDKLYWEFSFKESKQSHVNGIQLFVDSVPKFYYESNYKYIDLDPVFYKIFDVDDILNMLPYDMNVMYQHKNEMIYVLSKNTIWGINLKMYEYFQFNLDELIQKIHKRCRLQFIDTDGDMYQKYYKILPKYNRLRRYVIVMLSK